MEGVAAGACDDEAEWVSSSTPSGTSQMLIHLEFPAKEPTTVVTKSSPSSVSGVPRMVRGLH